MTSPTIYRFSGFTLDAGARRLCRGDTDLSLEPKSFRLLEFLLENHDRVLSKEEIFHVVWNNTIVTDNALTRAVAQIRRTLDDDPRQPHFIQTLPTVGYRFIGELNSPEQPTPATATANARRRVFLWPLAVVTVLAAAGLGAWRLWPRASERIVSAPVPLTTYRGLVEAPSFSPDGSHIAFQWNGEKQDNLDIYVRTIGADATPLRLTTDPLPDSMPAWSPDGSTIAFVRIVSPGQAQLILIPALGGPERRLARVPLWNDFTWDRTGDVPAWSADSRWLIMPELVEQQAALFRISVETGEMEQITHPALEHDDKSPAVSPDGRTLLFCRRPSFFVQGTLYTVGLDDNARPVETPKPVNFHALPIAAGVWMPDGRQIVARTPGGLYRLPFQGGEEAQPIPGTGGPEVKGVAISRQGNRLAYAVMQGDANIWRIDLTARDGKPEPLIASTARDVSPRYSPTGDRIAFQSARGRGKSQIWVGDAQGRQARQLTFVKQGLAGSPRWSPDGRTLDLDSNATGSYQIYTIDPDGGPMNQLTNDRFDNFGATWTRDGRSLIFTSTRTGRTEVWRMPAAGGPATQLTHNGGEFGIESDDGKTLYFARVLHGDSGSIWSMPIAGGPEKQLADSLYRSNYVVTRRGIYYMTHPGDSGTCALRLYDFRTGKTTTVQPIGRPELGLDVSPDGRYLLYAQFDDPSSGLMLLEKFR